MLRARKSFSIMVVLALVLSLGALVVPVGGVAANPSHIDVYSGESIQDAIDDADPGDIITVHPGTYGEDLAIDKSLTLQSSGGADETTIEGNVDIDLEDEEEALFGGAGAGFKVTNSSGDGIDARVYYWSSLTIEDNIITGNEYGIDIEDDVEYFSTLKVLDNEITDNGSDGIYLNYIEYHSDCLIEGNTISGNDWGIYIYHYVDYGSKLSILDNVITDNDSDGVYIEYIDDGSDCLIEGNTISGNDDGIDACYVDYGSTLSVLANNITGNDSDGVYIEYIDYGSDCLIEGNTISGNDDGIYINDYVSYGSTLSVLANNITGNDSDGFYIDYIDYGSACLIEGNTISGNDYGIDINSYVDYGSKLSILDNTITDNDYDGFFIEYIDDGSDCLIEGNTISGNEDGIYISDYVSYGSTLSVLANNITNNDFDGVYISEIRYGSEVNIGGSGNTISNNGGNGIYLASTTNSTVNILENVIDDNADDGIYVYVTHSMVNIEGNDITDNNDDGIDMDGSGLEFVSAHWNNIEDNTDYGIYNNSGEMIDAEYNWWDDASGPYDPNGSDGVPPCNDDPAEDKNVDGLGDSVSGDVDYCPWLNSGSSGIPAAGLPQPTPAEIDVYSGDSIQAAITTADSGDIITVHPGTYTENLTIDKSLTLQSSGGADETTIEGNVDIDLEDEKEVLFGGAGAGFTVTNSSGDGITAMVHYWSTLTIEDNIITGNDCGIDIDGYVDYFSTLNVLNNEITDNDFDGIYIDCIYYHSDCLIEGNTISVNDYGIYLSQYVYYGSSLSIVDNVITDNDSAGIYFNDYIGYGAEVLIEVNAISANGGSGIYLFDISDSTVNILENVICRNADEGIYLYVSHSMVTVEDNDILANYDGIYANGSDLYLTGIHQNDIEQNSDYGIYNDSGETLDAESNWWNDASGPSGAGPGEGDAVSANVLYDPWLTSAITVMHAAFSASPDSGTAPMKVQFSNQSQGPTRDWLWSFGDGVTSTEQSPSHTYDSHGTYTVTLEVSDACVSDTASATITVSKPQLQSEPNPASFYTCYLYITPQQVLPNQQVEISVNACNKGEERGSYTASLYINGILEDSQTVGVSGDSCQGAVFRVSKSQPGTYQVIVDGQEGYFTVVATSQQTSSSFGGGLGTGGIVVVALVIVALVLAIVLVFARMRRE